MSFPAPLGIIAGRGDLPLLACETAKLRTVPVVAVAFEDDVAEGLENLAETHLHRLGKAGQTFSLFRERGVDKVLFIGKFEKKLAFRDLLFDKTAVKIMAKFLGKSDSNIMLTIINELEAMGFTVEKQTDWLPDLLPEKGIIGKKKPSPAVRKDIEYGCEICRKMADMDIGQTVLVKELTVIAVEAVEGTDAAVRRACELAGPGVVMVKTSRPAQDLRFDIPSIGAQTARLLADCKAGGLAVEAQRTLVLDMQEVVSICDRAGIPFIAV